MTERDFFVDAVVIINKEIQWCMANPDMAFAAEYRKGFINGLIQAKYLLGELRAIDDGERWEKRDE